MHVCIGGTFSDFWSEYIARSYCLMLLHSGFLSFKTKIRMQPHILVDTPLEYVSSSLILN